MPSRETQLIVAPNKENAKKDRGTRNLLHCIAIIFIEIQDFGGIIHYFHAFFAVNNKPADRSAFTASKSYCAI